MAYGAKTYTLKEKAAEGGTRYSISFKDGQGEYHELEVTEQFFLNFDRWNAGTETFSNGISGTGSLTRCGMKRFTDVR